MSDVVTKYDLSTPAPLPREVGKRLLAQKETLAEEMRIALRKLLRLKTEVTVTAPVVVRVRHFSAFADGKAWWMSGGSKEEPAGKSVLLGCSPGFVYAAIDRTLGGTGASTAPEKPPTAIEFEFGMRFLRDVFVALANALQLPPLALAVAPHRPLNEPLLTYIPDLEEPFARISWKVKLLDQEHELLLCIARRLLEAAEPKQEAARAISGELAAPVAESPIELLVELARCRLKVEDAARLQAGDVVLFDLPPGEPLDVKVQNRSRFRARLGTHDGRYAIEVVDVVDTEEKAAPPAAKQNAEAAKPAAGKSGPPGANAPNAANGAGAAAAAAAGARRPGAAAPANRAGAPDKKNAGKS
jgi:flagellar motor switch protein FliM